MVAYCAQLAVPKYPADAVNAVAVIVLIAVILFAYTAPLTPTPPLTTNAPDPVFDDTVVLVMVIWLFVDAPKSVTSCKSCNVGPGS